jgi:hypothetical protein
MRTVYHPLGWKRSELPTELERQEAFAAFQEELADVLDWEMAQYISREGIIHT